MIDNGMTFPDLKRSEHWPTERTISGLVIGGLLIALLLALAVVFPIMAPLSAGLPAFVGGIGGSLMMAAAAFLLARQFGVPLGRRASGVRHKVDSVHGPGTELIVGRTTDLILVLVTTGCSIYGFCAWLDWRNGGDNLLPFSKANASGAGFMLVLSIVSAAVLLFLGVVLRWKITVELYPSGILRRNPVPFQDKERFVAWEDIASLVPSTFSSGQATDLPIIEAHLTDASVAPRNKMLDRAGIFGIPVHLIKTNRNALFSMLEFLQDHPDQRHLLASPEIDQWFIQLERRNKPGRLKRQTRKGEV